MCGKKDFDMSEQKQLTIETIMEMWDEDSSIDRNQISEETLKTPKLHAKYLQMLMQCKSKLIKYDSDYQDLKGAKFRYYRGEMSRDELQERGWDQWQGVKPLKSDMETFLESDKDLLKLKLRRQYYENMIYQLESIMKQIQNRDWGLKNHITMIQFLAGK